MCCCIDPGPEAEAGAENVSLSDRVSGEVYELPEPDMLPSMLVMPSGMGAR
jgi:hypothetical protein